MKKLTNNINKVLLNDKNHNFLSLIYFTATWCGPCKEISPKIEKLSAAFINKKKNINCYKIDIDEDEENYALNNNINSVPTFLIMDGDKILSKATGNNFINVCDMILNIYNKKYGNNIKI